MRMKNLREWHEKKHKFKHNHHRFNHKHHKEFHKYHRYLCILRPIAFLFNIFILYLMFRFIGIKGISVFFAVIFTIKEISYIFFLWRLEKRIFKPIEKLKKGVDEIAKGNYDIKVESDISNEIGYLINDFNNMAKKLKESEKIKIQYEENRKNLIANISHDLKTPITSIRGYTEAILDNAVSQDKLSKYLKTINNNIIYMDALIDDLFLFSKLDMQKLQFEYENIRIQSFMDDLMEEFKIELEEKEIIFNYIDKIDNNYTVYIDRKRIYQAIRNIIGNAVKYCSQNNLIIDVRLYKKENYICIDVKDNGPGISQDKLKYVFDRFYRIDNERTKDLMSTGLGLSIAKELIQSHKGEISVSSILNEGSCFTIALPISKV